MTKTLYAVSLTFALSPAFAGDAGGLGQNGPDSDSYYWAEIQMPGYASESATGQRAAYRQSADIAAMEAGPPARWPLNPELPPGSTFYGGFQ
jgi:hypothetical protein